VVEKRFDEREVSELIQRAAAIQAASESSSETLRPTLSQIQEAAGEMGIAPEHLARAAEELGSTSTGTSTSWRRTRTINGRITDDQWAGIVLMIRDATGRVGTPKAALSGYEWESSEPDGIHVALVPEGENTRVSVQGEFGAWWVLYRLLPMIFTIMAAVGFTAKMGMVGLLIAVLLVVTVGTAGYLAFKRTARKRQGQLEELFSQLTTQVSPTLQTSLSQLKPRPVEEPESVQVEHQAS